MEDSRTVGLFAALFQVCRKGTQDQAAQENGPIWAFFFLSISCQLEDGATPVLHLLHARCALAGIHQQFGTHGMCKLCNPLHGVYLSCVNFLKLEV